MTPVNAGTAAQYGGDDINKFADYLGGTDIGATDPATINTSTTYGLGKLIAPYLLPASYMIFQDNNGKVYALNVSTGTIQYQSATTPATSAETTSLFNSVFTNLNTTGGRVSLRECPFGPYMINGNVNIGNSAGTQLNTVIIFDGSGRDNTAIKFDATATSANMLQLFCTATVRGMAIDANNKSNHMLHCNVAVPVITTQDCAFKNGSVDIGYWTGSPLKAERIINNYFGDQTNFDQCASSVTDYSYCVGNTFDKRGVAANTGSCKTYGGGVNVFFVNNTVLRPANDLGFGCSIEGWGSAYKRVILANNNMENGQLYVGGQNSGTSTWDQILIENNNIYGGFIQVNSGTGLSAPSFELNRVIINGNNVSHAYWGGVMLSLLQGPTIISGNIISDSNQSLTGSNDRSNISLVKSNNVNIFGNTIYMLDTTTGANKAGVWQDHCTNAWIHDNIIVNSTAQAGYSNQFGGGGTNINLWDNQGYLTNAKGAATITGNGSTTAFNIAHGLAITPTIAFAQSDSYCYVSAKDGTNITVTFPTAPATGSHTVNWSAEKITGF